MILSRRSLSFSSLGGHDLGRRVDVELGPIGRRGAAEAGRGDFAGGLNVGI
jgi:hypothetical protein